MEAVLLVEGVAVMRVRRRLAQAAPAAGEGRGHRGVAALGSRVVARVDPVPTWRLRMCSTSRSSRARLSMKARLERLPG